MDANNECTICGYISHVPKDMYYHLVSVHHLSESDMVDMLFALLHAALGTFKTKGRSSGASERNNRNEEFIWRILKMDTSNVDHPSHYNQVPGIECIDVAEHFNYNRGNAIKYIWRAGVKSKESEVEDLQKAIWYIQREIERIGVREE